MKRLIVLFACAAFALQFIGCAAAKPTYFDLQPKEKVAVGHFAVNGYITGKGIERIEPGLLQNKVEFYKAAQLAIDSGAQVFFPALAAALPDVQVLSLADLSSNSAYQEASRPSEIKMLGLSKNESQGDVFPNEVGYVGASGTKEKADAMMTALGVDALILIKLDANLQTAMVGNKNIQIEAGFGPANYLCAATTANVSLYRKGKGKVWSKVFELVGTETGGAVGFLLADEKLPRVFVSSLQDLPQRLAAELDLARNKPVAPAK